MSYPIWITNASLGTVTSGDEAVSYTITASDSTSITVIDNEIPNSSIAKTATTIVVTFDAPNVTASTVYKIIIRAQNATGVTDRTFTLTVAAAPGISWTQDTILPGWVAGTRRELAFTASWIKPLEFVLLNGSLPQGVFLDATGKLYGIAGANLVATSTTSDNWDVSNSTFFYTGVSEFTIRARSIEQKNTYVDKTFTLYTLDTQGLDASSTDITADTTIISADASSSLPIVLLTSSNLGTYRHSNQFLKQLRAWNPTGEDLEYSIMGAQNAYDMQGYDEGSILGYDGYQATTAPYLQVELRNGYVTGLIPNIAYQDQYNSFSVAIKKVVASVTVQDTITPEFSLRVVGGDGVDFQFLDPMGVAITDAATYRYNIRKGEVSDLAINCYMVQNSSTPLFFELYEGNLPPGLTLTPRGYLSGKVVWATAEGVYSFSVKVYNPSQDYADLSPLTTQIQNFEIEVLPFVANSGEVAQAFNMYYRAYMANSQRTVWRNLVTDQRIFNNSIVYRSEDSEYGRSLECEFLAFVGIAESDAEQFADAVSQNWDLKRFRLGNVHYATVKDRLGNHVCDTVYVDIIDPQLNSVMEGPPQIVAIPSTDDLYSSIQEIYPATLQNQLARLQDGPGQATDSLLPQWMTSPQLDGRPLGWIAAAVLCHVKPGNGTQVLRKIKTSTHKLSYIDFHVDRMILKGATILPTITLFDEGGTLFDYTTFDASITEDKYIYFNTDGAIYDINN